MKKFAFVVIAVFAVLILTGCPEPDSGLDTVQDPEQEPVTYTVTYTGNGSTGGAAPSDLTDYEEGAMVYVSGDTGGLIKMQDGISLLLTGWNTQSDGNGTNYELGSATFLIGTSNVTLYANWTPISCTGPGGGIVFYDDTVGYDFDKDGTIQADEKNLITDKRYLESASVDQNSGSPIEWITQNSVSIGGLSQLIGAGSANADAILALDPSANAASRCRDYNGGGLSDWFLPSTDELKLMYEQRAVIGSFSADSYWSSSESSAISAHFINFDNGSWASTAKVNTLLVRAIRFF